MNKMTIDIWELQHCEGKLAGILIELNRAVMHNVEAPATTAKLSELLNIIHDRDSGLELYMALGQLCWPATYGQSPWDEVYDLLRSAILGHAPSIRTRAFGRVVYRAILNQVGLPAAQRRLQLDRSGRARRYQRLLRAMVEKTVLTYGEADNVLRTLLNTPPCQRQGSTAETQQAAGAGQNLWFVRQAYAMRATTEMVHDECAV